LGSAVTLAARGLGDNPHPSPQPGRAN